MTRSATSLPYLQHPAYAPAAYAPAPAAGVSLPINKPGEWYLTACLFMLLVEGVFNSWIGQQLTERTLFLFQLTPWNLWPSVLYFYSVGFAIGLWILLAGRKAWHAPTRGIMLYGAFWFVYAGWTFVGFLQHHPAWLQDLRAYALPSIIAPWIATLGKEVRFDVISRRFIKMAVPGAVLNAILGISFFARGGGVTTTFGELAPCWQAEYTLVLAYLLAFARSIASGKRATITLLILGAGITAPLDKPVLAMFLFANTALIYNAVTLGRRWKNIRVGNAVIVLTALTAFGIVFGGFMMTVGRGAGKEYVLDRIFKYHQSAHDRDIAGGRLRLWAGAMEEWKDQPLFGTGLGTRVVAKMRGEVKIIPIHNTYVETLQQTGLLGFSIITVVVLTWYFRVTRAIRDESNPDRFWPRVAMHTYVLSLLFSAAYGGTFGSPTIAHFLWVCVGLEAGAHSQQYAHAPAT